MTTQELKDLTAEQLYNLTTQETYSQRQLVDMLTDAAMEGKTRIGGHGFNISPVVREQLEENGFTVKGVASLNNFTIDDGVVISWDIKE